MHVNPAAAGLLRHSPAAGGNIFAPPPIFFHTMSSLREGVEERNFAHSYLHSGGCCVEIWCQSHVKLRHSDVTSECLHT